MLIFCVASFFFYILLKFFKPFFFTLINLSGNFKDTLKDSDERILLVLERK